MFSCNLLSRGVSFVHLKHKRKRQLTLPRLCAFCRLQCSLMQGVIKFPISQRARKPIPSSTPHPYLFFLERPQVRQTSRFVQFRQDRGGSDPWLLTQLSGDHSWRAGREKEELGGRVMLCERMQRGRLQLQLSVGLLICDSPEGEGADHQHCLAL